MSPVELTTSQTPPTMSCSRSPPAIGVPPKMWGVLRCCVMMPLSSSSEVVNSGVTSDRRTSPPAVERHDFTDSTAVTTLTCVRVCLPPKTKGLVILGWSGWSTMKTRESVTYDHLRFWGEDGAGYKR